ncbi:exodeoxyribonuclease VII small subunit [Bradymonadaceae bacterium TMQ3]|uniref:Exodeoxyribonuclease VII small subunit n=1 Tax=Lujinxingia sediminis TaxID=2480984 RepID=A0ABY0CT14_9DELT|nr:exodeoxyribonuclease VII small subunit [Lujinxingia sediminis]RDV38860.1 exodeoxyribonuclease VII small subunit [Bradymonadaceae bacterium TMQ3]RVU44095.1 exodeoxyribonuclease VII small subunit [Lujinxingia sediminis]TXC76367.1 exodeoxyribonuclease VII small subunit [Bradymonadales bacterium TMQ1]
MNEFTTPPDESLSYGEAMEELNRILAAIEGDAVDLDELGERVARAAELIRMCREKIDQTEFQVRTIIEELDGRDEG